MDQIGGGSHTSTSFTGIATALLESAGCDDTGTLVAKSRSTLATSSDTFEVQVDGSTPSGWSAVSEAGGPVSTTLPVDTYTVKELLPAPNGVTYLTPIYHIGSGTAQSPVCPDPTNDPSANGIEATVTTDGTTVVCIYNRVEVVSNTAILTCRERRRLPADGTELQFRRLQHDTLLRVDSFDAGRRRLDRRRSADTEVLPQPRPRHVRGDGECSRRDGRSLSVSCAETGGDPGAGSANHQRDKRAAFRRRRRDVHVHEPPAGPDRQRLQIRSRTPQPDASTERSTSRSASITTTQSVNQHGLQQSNRRRRNADGTLSNTERLRWLNDPGLTGTMNSPRVVRRFRQVLGTALSPLTIAAGPADSTWRSP